MTVAATYSPRRTDIMSASAEMLGLAMLQADPHGWRLDGATQLAAVRDALADGEATAKELRVRYSGLDPRGIAQAFRVPIEVSNDDPMVGTLWRLAEYQQRPPRILLYSRGLALLERAIVGALAEKLLGRANPAGYVFGTRAFPSPRGDTNGSADLTAVSADLVSNRPLALAHRHRGTR